MLDHKIIAAYFAVPEALRPEKNIKSYAPSAAQASSKRFHFAYFWLHVKGTQNRQKKDDDDDDAKVFGGPRAEDDDEDEEDEENAATTAASCQISLRNCPKVAGTLPFVYALLFSRFFHFPCFMHKERRSASIKWNKFQAGIFTGHEGKFLYEKLTAPCSQL